MGIVTRIVHKCSIFYMSRPAGIQTITAKEYLRDPVFFKFPRRKQARILYNENPLMYSDEEVARHILRYLAGKSGQRMKAHLGPNTEFIELENRPMNPYNLPDSDAEDFTPFEMPFYKKVFIINDLHLPYHDIPALTSALDYGLHHTPDAIFINGDALDIHQLSHFERDPSKKHFDEELNVFAQFMEILNDRFKCKIYFKFGNHEERYQKFLFQKARELSGVREFNLDNIVKARADCEVIKNKRIVVINGLPYIHGHEYGRGVFSPVNAARGLFLQTKHSAVKGDCHTTSEHNEPDIFGRIMTTYSVGALCGLTPQWLPLNKWNHGCAMQFNSDDHVYSLENKRIYKGKIL